jgi:uracil-DNA glycosylase
MSAMDEATRRDYLQSLGIDLWLPRAERMAMPAANKTVPRAAPVPALEAETVTATSDSWAAVRAEVTPCTRCALHRHRSNTVFGVGATSARWMVIGEAPGADEDAQGEPFVGRAGQLLNAMLKACGLERAEVFIANILKCRPPNNRDPQPDEVRECMPYLTRQIALLRPQLILAVGRIAAQNLLATETPLGRLRGQVHRYGALNTPLVVTYHPAYLLRSPDEKRKAWDDLKFAMSVCPPKVAA